MESIHLRYCPATEQIKAVELPGSKSMAARALIINALAGGSPSDMRNLPDGDDTRCLASALAALHTASGPADVNLGLGGTSLRFFTALAASLPGVSARVECAPGLARRPIAPLLAALKSVGADIKASDNRPPLEIAGKKLEGGDVAVDASQSSQFLSALMLVAPYWRRGLHVDFGGSTPVSFPYLEMTARMMERAGADVDLTASGVAVAPGRYLRGMSRDIEPDWSAASYFYELSLLMPGRVVRLARLTPAERSVQGDSGCAMIFGLLGVKTLYGADGSATLVSNRHILETVRTATDPIVFNMGRMPDLVPALAVALCLSGVRFRLTGIAHLRHKECDRLGTLASELGKLGYCVEETPDALLWNGATRPAASEIEIDTHGDHRMAMAFAAAAVVRPEGITLREPTVAAKSFPSFFAQIARLGIRPR